MEVANVNVKGRGEVLVKTTAAGDGLGVDVIECPLCVGRGQLKRSEVLERLGMKDFSRVAQLSAEEAFRMLLKKQKEDETSVWLRFESELTKRVSELQEKHKNEILALQTEKSGLDLRLRETQKNQEALLSNARESERLEAEKCLRNEILMLEGRIKDLQATQKVAEQQRLLEIEKVKSELENSLQSERAKTTDLNRSVQDYLVEIAKLREKNNALESEMSKIVRVGRREEIDFAEEVQSWPCIWVSEKLKRYGDYILAYREPNGSPAEPRMVVDNKDKETVTEADVEKLVRDAREQRTPVAILLTREESQLRQVDKDSRWASKDSVWVLRTTRQWLRRDLDVVRPVLERMRTEGADFLERNSVLAEQVRRSLNDIDEMDKKLRKAANAIDRAKVLAMNYKTRLQSLCDSALRKPAVSGKDFSDEVAV